jgi:hypothetical protein
MLAFIQHNFGLASLNSAVDAAYDYANSFDFAQAPLSRANMVLTPISAAEQRQLALPQDPTDPT